MPVSAQLRASSINTRTGQCYCYIVTHHSHVWARMGSLTAEQLADKLGTIKKKLSGAELIADDKVVKNFVDLNLPVNSEVFKYFLET